MCLKQPLGHKLFLVMVCAINLYCHLTEIWVVFDFFSLAQGVHILTVCQSCSYPWCNPSFSKYTASSLSFLCSWFTTPCAEREMLPDRALKRLEGWMCHFKSICLDKKLLSVKIGGQILWSTLTSLPTWPAASLQKGQAQVWAQTHLEF